MSEHQDSSTTPGPANPKQGIATGRTKLNEFAAQLASQHLIEDQDHESTYPITRIQLSVPLLIELFARILWSIVRGSNREFGYPNYDAAAQIALRGMCHDVAWQAVQACHTVLYNKGIKILPVHFGQMIRPFVSFQSFPITVVALINSIGPIVQDGFPARRTYVPYIDVHALNNARGNNYDEDKTSRFFEKLPKTKFAIGNVEPFGTESNAWPFLYPVNGDNTPTTDTYVGNGTLPLRTLLSPVPYSEIPDYAKALMISIGQPIANPGLAHFSVTPFYEMNELNQFTPTPPRVPDFPAVCHDYPYYDRSFRAVHRFIEEGTITVTSNANESSTDRLARARAMKRRAVTGANGSPQGYAPTSPTQSGPSSAEVDPTQNTTTITVYRIVSLYFNHKAVDSVTPNMYTTWPQELCKI